VTMSVCFRIRSTVVILPSRRGVYGYSGPRRSACAEAGPSICWSARGGFARTAARAASSAPKIYRRASVVPSLARPRRQDGTRGLLRPKLSPHRQRRPLLCNRFEVVSYGRVRGARRALPGLVSQPLVKVGPRAHLSLRFLREPITPLETCRRLQAGNMTRAALLRRVGGINDWQSPRDAKFAR
jgi:hypothetical protein